MNRFAIVTVGILVVASAIVHGAVTQRWTVFASDRARTERIHALELRYADYECSEIPHDVPLKERSIATSRKYSSESQGLTVMTSIISGIPGAVATHTPDVCYTSSGFQITRGPSRETIELPNGSQAEYYVADFEKKNSTATERLRIRWSWSDQGKWTAPAHPRFAFVRVPELYKLYLVTTLPEGDDSEDSSAGSPASGSSRRSTVRNFLASAFAQYADAIARP